MILFLIQPSVVKQMLEFCFQVSMIVGRRVINPDGIGPDGGESIMFCFNVQVEVIE
jgi:hypothetical protein